MQVGQRKLVVTLSTTFCVLGLSFLGLMVGKLSGAEFVSTTTTVCLLVGGFLGLNVASKFTGGKGDQ
jgi:hypothetical protein